MPSVRLVVFQCDQFATLCPFRLPVGHLEEEQVRQLLDVVAIAHPVVAEDVVVVPELLDDSRRPNYDGPLLAFRFFHSVSDQS